MRDAGLGDQFGRLYSHSDWVAGTTTATILATLQGKRACCAQGQKRDQPLRVAQHFSGRLAYAAQFERFLHAALFFALHAMGAGFLRVRARETPNNQPSLAQLLTFRPSLTCGSAPPDYFGDISTFVEPGFAKRVAELVLEEVGGLRGEGGVVGMCQHDIT
jgi:hypothetical protein